MNKKAIFLACAILLLCCIFSITAIVAVVLLRDKNDFSRDEAIDYLQDRFPELKEYPSDSLPPKSIRTEKENDDWYLSFIQEGSGRPIISAKCYHIKSDKSIETKEFISHQNNYNTEFSIKECTTIESDEKPNGDTTKCGLETCHGLDVKCGPNIAEVCDASYQLGDKCLQYAECGVEDGQCKQIPITRFLLCKSCVENCQSRYENDFSKLFECESGC